MTHILSIGGRECPERAGRPEVVGEKYNKLDLEQVEFEDQTKTRIEALSRVQSYSHIETQ